MPGRLQPRDSPPRQPEVYPYPLVGRPTLNLLPWREPVRGYTSEQVKSSVAFCSQSVAVGIGGIGSNLRLLCDGGDTHFPVTLTSVLNENLGGCQEGPDSACHSRPHLPCAEGWALVHPADVGLTD